MTQSPESILHGRRWELPPLILHPFGRGVEAAASLDSIKLALHLAGLGAPDVDREAMLSGRYCEFRMLCLAGKDAMRWVAQCVDFAGRDDTLSQAGIRAQSFADLLVNRTPPDVAARFQEWGVIDYRRVFGRALGVRALFPNPPDLSSICPEFLENYYAYADGLFACHQALEPYTPLDPAAFHFALYTSDEYLSTLQCGAGDEPA